MSNQLEKGLRDEIVRLVNNEIREQGIADPASAEAIDEDADDGGAKAVVIDDDANCYRVTVKQI